jgi:DNA-binding transcriptional LysR family regulator
MNIDQARTFLEVAATGNFNRAAERLNVTQSTVSARVRALEDELGRRLFERDKAGARLTLAGAQFRRHAEALLRTFQQARPEIALPHGFRAVLGIGAEAGLWPTLAAGWLPELRRRVPDIALRAEHGFAADLLRRLGEGALDLAVVHEGPARPGLVMRQVGVDELILVAHAPRDLVRWHPLYVYVDWGEAFRDFHARAYPVDEIPAVTVELGAAGLAYILAGGGSGYFPRRDVAAHLAAGRLHEVPRAPAFRRPVHLASRPGAEREDWFAPARDALAAVLAGATSRRKHR